MRQGQQRLPRLFAVLGLDRAGRHQSRTRRAAGSNWSAAACSAWVARMLMHADKTRAGTPGGPATVFGLHDSGGEVLQAQEIEMNEDDLRVVGPECCAFLDLQRNARPSLPIRRRARARRRGESPRRGVFDLRRRDVLQAGSGAREIRGSSSLRRFPVQQRVDTALTRLKSSAPSSSRCTRVSQSGTPTSP